jgi:FtsH-binding integral membrane protein
MASHTETLQRPLTRAESGTPFSQTMGLVAITAAAFALVAYVARDVSPGWTWLFYLAAFAALVGVSAATRRSEQVGFGLLFGFGFLIGAAVAPTLAHYAGADPQARWEAAGVTALFVAGFGAAGYATRGDLSQLARIRSWALLAASIFLDILNVFLLFLPFGWDGEK